MQLNRISSKGNIFKKNKKEKGGGEREKKEKRQKKDKKDKKDARHKKTQKDSYRPFKKKICMLSILFYFFQFDGTGVMGGGTSCS